MSGGKFDYKDMCLKDEIFRWSDKPVNVFEDREISEIVWDIFDLIHEYDWYASGDTEEETYLKKKKEFKDKWLRPPAERVQDIIDKVLDEARAELYKTYGV